MDHFSLVNKFIAILSGLGAGAIYGLILAILFVCGIGVPIPEDITLITAGILVSLGKINLVGACIVCFIGVLVGDVILFVMGRKYGRRVF